MQTNKIIVGDAVDILRNMETGICDMCVTSPPYYGLRDYETPGQIGLETSPEEYIERLVEVFREVHRVLKDDGTLWINIGDSYATRSGAQPPSNTRNRCGHTAKAVPAGYKAKDLIGIPWMLAFALRADGWYLRQDIIWQKTNCNVGRQNGSDRQPGKTNGSMKAALPRFGGSKYGDDARTESRTKSGALYKPQLRKNKRDVWPISTSGFKGAHFATFPPALVRPLHPCREPRRRYCT